LQYVINIAPSHKENHYATREIQSETPPAGAGGIFWLQAKNELEPSFGRAAATSPDRSLEFYAAQ